MSTTNSNKTLAAICVSDQCCFLTFFFIIFELWKDIGSASSLRHWSQNKADIPEIVS